MRNESRLVDALLVSRVAHCQAISVCFQGKRREFAVIKSGQKLRQVESTSDGDRWYFRQEGTPQAFEEVSEYTRSPRSERLSVEAVKRYFIRFTGLELPLVANRSFTTAVGLERSTKDLLVPVARFKTLDDLPCGDQLHESNGDEHLR